MLEVRQTARSSSVEIYTVHPRNASGFAHVDCDRVLRDAEVAEEIQFDPELDLLSIDRPKDPLGQV